MNNVAENNIIWSGFKDSNDVDVALVDTLYYTSSPSQTTKGNKYFNMSHWGDSIYYGWKGSDFHYDILGATSIQPDGYGSKRTNTVGTISAGYNNYYAVGYNATSTTLTNPNENTLLATLPSELRNNLRLFSRWIDLFENYVEEDVNVNITIEETIDAVTLLAETEIYGTRYAQNLYESNSQTQMEYYATGNAAIFYHYDDTSTKAVCLTASRPGSYVACYNTDGSRT